MHALRSRVINVVYINFAGAKPTRKREGMSMESETLIESAIRVLNTSDPYEKARLGDSIAVKWLQGAISEPYDSTVDLPVPDRPARLTNVSSPPFPSFGVSVQLSVF